jgi:hypothetical protein
VALPETVADTNSFEVYKIILAEVICVRYPAEFVQVLDLKMYTNQLRENDMTAPSFVCPFVFHSQQNYRVTSVKKQFSAVNSAQTVGMQPAKTYQR